MAYFRVLCWARLLVFWSLLLSCGCSRSTDQDVPSADYDEELPEGSKLSGSSSAFSGSTYSGSGSSSSSGGSTDWGDDDNAGTVLCSGIIDTNSSRFINSSTEYSFSGCDTNGHRCNLRNFITLSTSNLSYVGTSSTITAHVNPNATNGSKFYYKLCYTHLTAYESPELIRCVSNGTTMQSEYYWERFGKVMFTVYVYMSPSYNTTDFLDCDSAKVLVANDSGLKLTVTLDNDPYMFEDDQLVSMEISDEVEFDRNETNLFLLGNITFHVMARLESGRKKGVSYLYHYHVHGPYLRHSSRSAVPNMTLEIMDTGSYTYTVDAIGYFDKAEAHHANYTGSFQILEAVNSAFLQVGNNNTVKLGSEEELVASAEGSVPITFCWSRQIYQTKGSADQADGPPEPPDWGPPDPPPPPHHHQSPLPPQPRHYFEDIPKILLETCVILNDSNSTVFKEKQLFNTTGTIVFTGRFFNLANEIRTNLSIQVVSGISPVVVASSATAVVVCVTLVALLILSIVLFMAVYVPYKKYKNRMTETADFKFVDLTEKTNYWQRLKQQSHRAVDYFRRRRHREKIGLVNLSSTPQDEERRRLFYGTNTLTQFAPYETL